MTTYDYILWQRQLKREREEAEEEEGVADQEPHGRCWFLRRKVSILYSHTTIFTGTA